MTTLQERINEVANWCIKNGVSVIPIGEGKVPAIKWMAYQDSVLPEWNYDGCNIGIVTGEFNKIAVIDCDNYESYVWWMANMPATPLMTKTKRGMHFYYRHPGDYVKNDCHVSINGSPEYDVRGDGGYVVIGPSMRDGYQYHFCVTEGNLRGGWLNPDMLPVFDMAWRPERAPTESIWEGTAIKDMAKYIAKVFAVEGQGGDKETYRICRKMCENEIPEGEAMALLAEWNQTNCTPPWTIRELHRKLKTAYAK